MQMHIKRYYKICSILSLYLTLCNNCTYFLWALLKWQRRMIIAERIKLKKQLPGKSVVFLLLKSFYSDEQDLICWLFYSFQKESESGLQKEPSEKLDLELKGQGHLLRSHEASVPICLRHPTEIRIVKMAEQPRAHLNRVKLGFRIFCIQMMFIYIFKSISTNTYSIW